MQERRKLISVAQAINIFGEEKTRQLTDFGINPKTLRFAAKMVSENKCGTGHITDIAKVWELIHQKLTEKRLPDNEIEKLQLRFIELSAKTGNHLGMPNVLKTMLHKSDKKGETPTIAGFDILHDLENIPFRALAAKRFSNTFQRACNYVYSYHRLQASDKPGARPTRITISRRLNREEIVFGSWLLSFNPRIFASVMEKSLRRFEGREIGVICAFAIAFDETRTLMALKTSEKHNRGNFIRALLNTIENKKPGVDSSYHALINQLESLENKLK